MKSRGNYKGLILLVLLFMAVPLITWQLTLSGTYKTSRETARLKKTLSGINATTGDNRQALTLPDHEDCLTTGLIIDEIMPCIESNKVRVTEYQPYTNETNGNLTMLSAEITLAGSYVSILKVIDTLENTVERCKVKSVTFEKTTDRKERTDVLKGIIIIQQLISNP